MLQSPFYVRTAGPRKRPLNFIAMSQHRDSLELNLDNRDQKQSHFCNFIPHLIMFKLSFQFWENLFNEKGRIVVPGWLSR